MIKKVKCPICKKVFRVSTHFRGRKKYCSKKCALVSYNKLQKKYRDENFKKEGHLKYFRTMNPNTENYKEELTSKTGVDLDKVVTEILPNSGCAAVVNYRNFWKRELIKDCI